MNGNPSLATEIRYTRDRSELEALADRAQSHDNDAKLALLERLPDALVQDDPDTESAVCDALVRLGAMTQIGNLNYEFTDSGLDDAAGKWPVHAKYRRLK